MYQSNYTILLCGSANTTQNKNKDRKINIEYKINDTNNIAKTAGKML